MLDREVVKEFLEDKPEKIEIPADISMDALVETFCRYTEDDYYEWLKDTILNPFSITGTPTGTGLGVELNTIQKIRR
ncbi:MAG: hypothetical protein AB1393_04500 [Candidatus Edwardsbacteria bacterium]